MSQQHKISVIIPTHTGFENITRAVDSVLSQSYKNVEIFVVDDNGKDSQNQIKTEQQMKKYSALANVTYLVHEKNINGSAARNTGIRASSGDYIAFLDDDDYFNENNLQRHIDVFENLPGDYGVTYCGMRLIVENKKDKIIMPEYEGDILFDFFCGKMRIGSSLIMIKREVLDYVKEFDESFRRHQDWEFLARILCKYKCGKVDNVGVNKCVLLRNNAKNPKVFEQNRIYYLEKMKPIIEKFDKKEQRQIYDIHYCAIGKEYLRAKDIRGCIRWTRQTSNPFKTGLSYVFSFLQYLRK